MATNNRGGSNRGRRSSNNNNPQGHNQYDRGWVDTAKERPMATAAAAAAAVGAGVFLWSRRNQISDQISGLSEQISEWRDSYSSSSDYDSADSSAESFMASSQPRRSGKKSQADISAEAMTLKETGKATA